MFKYSFLCGNEGEIRSTIKQMKEYDFPSGKSIFGGDLYEAGIHFRECDNVVTGFYVDESESENLKGSPLHLCFRGEFKQLGEELRFDVYIFPHIFELLFLLLFPSQFLGKQSVS